MVDLYAARLARRTLRRFRQSLRYGRGALGQSPILFANSFPKSGTHLLTQVLQGFSQIGPAVDSGLPAIVTFDGFTGRQRGQAEILADLQRLLPGDIAYGHVHAFPGAVERLCQPGHATYFILRDPRDIAVSHVHYVAEMAPNHIHHRYYQDVLQTFDERLQASLAGISDEAFKASYGEDTQADVLCPPSLPNIRERFEPYLNWLEHADGHSAGRTPSASAVLVLHFEEFLSDQRLTVTRIFEHAVKHGFAPSLPREAAIQILLDNIDPQRSPTFRSGKSGGWRDAFKEQHKTLFKEIAGDLLMLLGYETNSDW